MSVCHYLQHAASTVIVRFIVQPYLKKINKYVKTLQTPFGVCWERGREGGREEGMRIKLELRKERKKVERKLKEGRKEGIKEGRREGKKKGG